jgi:hypothetical protein
MSNPNEVDIPPEFLITNSNDPVKAIVQSTYPNLLSQYQNGQFMQSRAILASTVEAVDQINDYILKLVPGIMYNYFTFVHVTIQLFITMIVYFNYTFAL